MGHTHGSRWGEGGDDTNETDNKDKYGCQYVIHDSEGEQYGIEGDVPRYILTLEYRQVQKVYRDWVHANNGNHLDGGISKYGFWQTHWRDFIVITSH